MPEFTVNLGGEPTVLSHENTMVYLFPTRPELNHVYINLDRSVAVRGAPELINALMGCGFPICTQVFPRQSEIDSFADSIVDDLDAELEGFSDDEAP